MSRFTLLLLSAMFCAAWVSCPTPASAQEEDAAAAAPAEGGAAAEAEKPKSQSYLMWFIKSSGLIGLVILILSIYFVATTIRLFIELRPEVAAPPDLVHACDEGIEQRDFQKVFETARDDESFLGRTLSAGLGELTYGLSEARTVMDQVGEAETVELEKQISMLAVLGTLGPMIGLIGTLKGMIASFSVIAMSDTQLKASEVAGGISEALLLTFEGVALSIPAIWFFAVFRNRVAHISAATMLEADSLLRRFFQAATGKGKAAPQGAVPMAVPGQATYGAH